MAVLLVGDAPYARIYVPEPIRANVKVGDKAISNVSELLSTVAALKPGVETKFAVLRGDATTEITIVPGKRPAPQKRVQQR